MNFFLRVQDTERLVAKAAFSEDSHPRDENGKFAQVTVRYAQGMKGSVKEKTFPSQAHLDKWMDKNGDNITVHAYSTDKSAEHPGFAAVQSKIQGEGYSKDVAGAILANATRNASESAKDKNPRLRKVKDFGGEEAAGFLRIFKQSSFTVEAEAEAAAKPRVIKADRLEGSGFFVSGAQGRSA